MQQEGSVESGGALQGSAVSIETPAALSEYVRSDSFVIVHFEAPWCEPCREMQSMLETLPVTVAVVDVERVPTLAMDYGVETLPTLVVFKDGEPVTRRRGRLDLDELHSLLGRYG